jgi:hypothetical protein
MQGPVLFPLARPFTQACTFPPRTQSVTSSRSSQTFAFASLGLISNRATAKRHSIGTFQSEKLYRRGNPPPKLGSRCPCTVRLKNALVVGQHALGLPPFPCPVAGKAGTLRHGTVPEKPKHSTGAGISSNPFPNEPCLFFRHR